MFNKKSQFEEYIQSFFLEKQGDDAAPPQQGAEAPPAQQEGDDAQGEDVNIDTENLENEFLDEEDEVFPEEIELAKLAIRAIYFNPSSKDVHKLKMRVNGEEIPFEKISDYYESTKNIIPVLGFIEWAMNKYEGISSKWTEQPDIRGKNIKEKMKEFKKLPEEEQLDNGKRVYWTRIVLNCLLHGDANFNINIGDVNEKTIKEVFRLLNQHFSGDTRGMFVGTHFDKGPGTF